MKTCRVCKKEQDGALFPKTGKGYISHRCKSCTADYKKKRKERLGITVSEADKRWKAANREHYLRSMRSWHLERKNDPGYIVKRVKTAQVWYKNNKEKAINQSVEYARARKKRDPLFRAIGNLRSYLSHTLKTRGLHKSNHLMDLLGCDWPSLKTHLESRFVEGMTWDNYGEWHIDHVNPLASFDLSQKDELVVAWHYTNLQPLWAEDNLRKSDKISK